MRGGDCIEERNIGGGEKSITNLKEIIFFTQL